MSFDICVYPWSCHNQADEYFYQFQKFPLTALKPIPFSTPFSDDLWSAFCQSRLVYISGVLYTWYHAAYIRFCLASLIQHNDFMIYPYSCMHQ